MQIYRATDKFPREELYGLTSQLRRAAVSVPSNIAEGHTRASTRDFLHHISIAHGSLSEVVTQLLLARRLEFIASERATGLLQEAERIGRMLRGLRRSLAKRV